MFMQLSTIYSIWDVIRYPLRLIDFSDYVPLRVGKMLRHFRVDMVWVVWADDS